MNIKDIPKHLSYDEALEAISKCASQMIVMKNQCDEKSVSDVVAFLWSNERRIETLESLIKLIKEYSNIEESKLNKGDQQNGERL